LIGNIAVLEYRAMKVGPLPPDRSRHAARLLADAFRDYPAWLAIGPRRSRPRWRMLNRFYRGALVRAYAHGAVLGAGDGELRGIAIVYPADRWPPPPRSFVHEAWGVALSGPGAAARGLRATSAIDAVHPHEPHDFLHTLGVDPGAQRTGAGTALLEHIAGHAEGRGVPVHLTTSDPENLPYYRRFGYQLDGQRELPRGVPLWSMLRPPARAPEPGSNPSSPRSASP
jgi:GNAT superfamily N-acetyltransferase